MRRSRALLIALALLVVPGGCRRGQTPAPPPGEQRADPVARKYSLPATKVCLVAAGATVTDVQPRDAESRALRDLAQQNSLEAVFGGRPVGLALVPTAGESKQLAELLDVPDNPYRLVVRGNVVLMYAPSSEEAFQLTAGCLRE